MHKPKLLLSELNGIIGDYPTQVIDITNGLSFNQFETIRMIEHYSNSHFLNGDKDELGRDKPFYNTVNAAVDVSVVATDIDTKDVQITADTGQDYDKSFVLTKDIYQWMKDVQLARVFNEFGETRARYGGVLVKKFINEDGELKLEIPEWKNLVTDPVDIINGVIIEKHYMSPSMLSKKMEVWEDVKAAMKLATKHRADAQNQTGIGSEATSKKVPVYEIHGEFPISFYKECSNETVEEEDHWIFHRYLFFVAGDKEKSQHVLYYEEEDENPYKYLPWKKVSGRALGRGVVEEGEQAQIWTNDAVIKEQRAMELAGKPVLQSASKKLKGKNVLTEVDEGQILEHEENKPISMVNLRPSAMDNFQNLVEKWHIQYERTTATYAAQRGENPPAGQPFRLQALVQQQSGSQFDHRTEEAGIFWTEIFNDWVFPWLSAKLNKAHILATDYSAEELAWLDENYGNYRANQAIKQKILAGEVVSPEDYELLKTEAKEFIGRTKGQRFLDIPENYYKDIKAKVTVSISGEQKNKMAMMESIYNIITLYMSNPMLAQDPILSQLFGKLVEMSGAGISPLQMGIGAKPNPAALPQPGAPQPGAAPVPDVKKIRTGVMV